MPISQDGTTGQPDLSAKLRSAVRAGGISLMPRVWPEGIEDLIGTVPVCRLPTIKTGGTPREVAREVRSGLASTGFGPPRLAEWLCFDVEELTAAFAAATGVTLVGVQFAPIIEHRPLDIDGLGCRLVTSYRGSTSSWLRPRLLAYIAPAWPVPPEVGPLLGQGSALLERPDGGLGVDRLLLCIDDYGRC